MTALPKIPCTLTSDTRDMDCEVRNAPFVKATTLLCDMMTCGAVDVQRQCFHFEGRYVEYYSTKVILTQAVWYTSIRMYGVTYQNKTPLQFTTGSSIIQCYLFF